MTTRIERLLPIEELIRRGRYPHVDTFCEMCEVKNSTFMRIFVPLMNA